MASQHADVERVLISEDEIAARVREVGAQIASDYAGRTPHVIGILKGSFVFMADLVRQIQLDCTCDFMKVSSYGNDTTSSGTVTIKQDLSADIRDRHVIVCEDIIDTGLTLKSLVELLKERKPASIAICAFTVKDIPGYTPKVDTDYACFHVPDEFVVGYGLDYAERYRDLPYVGVLKPEVYS